jgi:hypothetical protein
MKKLFTLFVFLFTLSAIAQTTRRVLFLGNSYTYVNNLPQMLADLANSVGDNVIFDGNTIGGYTFQNHSTDATSLAKIAAGNWDFVVLQEQSQLPSLPINQVKLGVFPYARFLDSLINVKNPCAETIFYMTWGRKNGDASNCAGWPPVCSYRGMDSLLNLRYRMMADSNHAILSPVGAVWNYIRQNFPLTDLYQADESHPSLAGTYAAACCFYATVFRKDPTLITNDYGLPATDAANIRQAAKTIVYNNLLNWHIGQYDPVANFSFAPPVANSLAFTNLSVNADTYSWDFGDGATSTVTNPTHVYPSNGNFSVTLTAKHCTYTDTKIIPLTVSTIDGVQNNTQEKIFCYPNPVADQLLISLNRPVESIYVINSAGQVFYPTHKSTGPLTSVNFSPFPKGVYVIVVNEQFRQRLIK